MESSQSENLLKIPGTKIFQSSFTLKTNIPDPFPGPILMIPPSDPQRLQRPRITGLDLSHVSPLYIPRNMHVPLRDLYKLFELKPDVKDTELQEDLFEKTDQHEINKLLGEDLSWTEENDMILTHSGKKTLRHSMGGDSLKPRNIIHQKQGPKINPKVKTVIEKKVFYSLEIC